MVFKSFLSGAFISTLKNAMLFFVDYLINCLMRLGTYHWTRCPTLFDKWHGIFYIPSRTDTVGHTNAFHMDHCIGG